MTQAQRDRGDYVEITGTNAERLAFNNPKQAMEWYETDTTARFKYVSGAWISITGSGGIAPGYGAGGGGGGSSTYTLGAPVSVAVAITDTVVIAANPSRKKLIIQVNGGSDVALSFGAGSATLAAGVLLQSNDNGAGYAGGSFTCEHLGAVHAIARSSPSSVTVTEGT